MNSFEARMKAKPIPNNPNRKAQAAPVEGEKPTGEITLAVAEAESIQQTPALNTTTLVLPGPAPKKKSISLYIEIDTYKHLKQISKKYGVSISVIANTALKQFVSEFKD